LIHFTGAHSRRGCASVPLIHLETSITAPASVAFDVMRDVGVHLASAARTEERVVAGRTTGLFEAGEVVTWEGVHLGVRQRLTSRVTECDPPRVFVDEMVRGAFASFKHTHVFRAESLDSCVMFDDVEYRAPLGPLGRIAELLVVDRWLRAFLTERAGVIRAVAEERFRSVSSRS
jgi:ligand-binding SRPBCC domain-containing protein